jgi:hypothetical protein
VRPADRGERRFPVYRLAVVEVGVESHLKRFRGDDEPLGLYVVRPGTRLTEVFRDEIHGDTGVLLGLRVLVRLGRAPLKEREDTKAIMTTPVSPY